MDYNLHQICEINLYWFISYRPSQPLYSTVWITHRIIPQRLNFELDVATLFD